MRFVGERKGQIVLVRLLNHDTVVWSEATVCQSGDWGRAGVGSVVTERVAVERIFEELVFLFACDVEGVGAICVTSCRMCRSSFLRELGL